MLLSSDNIKARKYQEWVKIALILIVSLILAWSAYHVSFNNKVDELKNIQHRTLFTTATLFSRELGSLSNLLQLLANSPNLAIDSFEPFQDKNRLISVQEYFSEFGKVSPNIAQIRWLDHSGQEMVRVNFSSTQTPTVQTSGLQDKRSRYYFKQGMKVPAPKIYFSPIDLNIEQSKVVLPYEPTIRATIKTSSKTHFLAGLIIVNYRLDNLLNTIKDISVADTQINIVNQQGYWLVNPQPKNEWGFMLGQPQLTLKNESPVIWEYLSQHPTGGDIIIDNQLSSFAPLATFAGSHSDANQLLLYTTSDKRHLVLAHSRSFYIALAVFLAFTLTGLAVNWRAYRYQGNLIDVSLKLRNEHQELNRVNKSLRENIAQQQLLQDELVEAHKLSSLGLMVAGVAHELNTPIGGAIISISIATNANLEFKNAMDKGITKSQFRAGVEAINGSLDMAKINLDKAVNHIKRFKRLAIDRVNEDYLDCSLNVIVSDLIASVQPRLKNGNVVIVEDIAPNLALISRPGIISQVLENLMTNSFTHGFAPGQTGIIEIKARKNGQNQICITVSDNGSGIPAAMQASVFEPFVTSNRGAGNIGLGLYMVNQWVTKLLAGKLSFISEAHISREFVTQFTILLPLESSQDLI